MRFELPAASVGQAVLILPPWPVVMPAECNDNLEGLDDKCLQTLQDWVKKFTQKYKIVGKVASV
jgi:hypothetical protein